MDTEHPERPFTLDTLDRDSLLKRVDHLETAIRDHRGTKTPMSWNDADKKLYKILPELEKLE